MNKPDLIVPDASIVLAFILNEPIHQTHLQLFFERAQAGKYDLLCPALLHHEVANRLSRIPSFPGELIRTSLQAYSALELTPDTTAVCLNIVRKYGVVWYDAVYHAVALVCGGTLVTGDKRYYDSTKSEGHSLYIEDYE